MNISSSLRLESSGIVGIASGGVRPNGSHLYPKRGLVFCSSAKPPPPQLVVEQTNKQKLSRVESLSQVSAVLGCQWGDEGKGKLVDILANHFDIVARCQVIPQQNPFV